MASQSHDSHSELRDAGLTLLALALHTSQATRTWLSAARDVCPDGPDKLLAAGLGGTLEAFLWRHSVDVYAKQHPDGVIRPWNPSQHKDPLWPEIFVANHHVIPERSGSSARTGRQGAFNAGGRVLTYGSTPLPGLELIEPLAPSANIRMKWLISLDGELQGLRVWSPGKSRGVDPFTIEVDEAKDRLAQWGQDAPWLLVAGLMSAVTDEVVRTALESEKVNQHIPEAGPVAKRALTAGPNAVKAPRTITAAPLAAGSNAQKPPRDGSAGQAEVGS